jgi:hypothetical protein
MSLCYDFQKWTMITLAAVAISLSVGLVLQYAHGQEASPTCTIYNSETLKVLSLSPSCGGNPFENIVYYMNLGYHIATANNELVFLVK